MDPHSTLSPASRVHTVTQPALAPKLSPCWMLRLHPDLSRQNPQEHKPSVSSSPTLLPVTARLSFQHFISSFVMFFSNFTQTVPYVWSKT